MKNKYIFVAALLVVLTISSYIISVTGTKIEKDKDELLVVTSFYPVYIAALNVTDGVEDVQVSCLTQSTTGCVHDIQLTTQDMRLLEQADLFIVNGADMESYLDSIKERYPNLKIVDTSEGVQLLESSGEHHHEEEDSDVYKDEHQEDNHEETRVADNDTHDDRGANHDHVHNSHIWMDMDNYCIQVSNIGNALAQTDESNKSRYDENVTAYQQKVKALQEEARALAGEEHLDAVSTHEAFSYFANNMECHILGTINMDENTSLHAAQVSEIIDIVKTNHVSYVFTEELYGMELSDMLKKETGCETIVLDTLVTGTEDKDAYLDGMKKNIETLKEVTGR